jgi:hypothetical protein
MEAKRIAYRIVVGSRSRILQNSIKMSVREVSFEDMKWVQLTGISPVVIFVVSDNEAKEKGTDHHHHHHRRRRHFSYNYHYYHYHSNKKIQRASLTLKKFSPH